MRIQARDGYQLYPPEKHVHTNVENITSGATNQIAAFRRFSGILYLDQLWCDPSTSGTLNVITSKRTESFDMETFVVDGSDHPPRSLRIPAYKQLLLSLVPDSNATSYETYYTTRWYRDPSIIQAFYDFPGLRGELSELASDAQAKDIPSRVKRGTLDTITPALSTIEPHVKTWIDGEVSIDAGQDKSIGHALSPTDSEKLVVQSIDITQHDNLTLQIHRDSQSEPLTYHAGTLRPYGHEHDVYIPALDEIEVHAVGESGLGGGPIDVDVRVGVARSTLTLRDKIRYHIPTTGRESRVVSKQGLRALEKFGVKV